MKRIRGKTFNWSNGPTYCALKWLTRTHTHTHSHSHKVQHLCMCVFV